MCSVTSRPGCAHAPDVRHHPDSLLPRIHDETNCRIIFRTGCKTTCTVSAQNSRQDGQHHPFPDSPRDRRHRYYPKFMTEKMGSPFFRNSHPAFRHLPGQITPRPKPLFTRKHDGSGRIVITPETQRSSPETLLQQAYNGHGLFRYCSCIQRIQTTHQTQTRARHGNKDHFVFETIRSPRPNRTKGTFLPPGQNYRFQKHFSHSSSHLSCPENRPPRQITKTMICSLNKKIIGP